MLSLKRFLRCFASVIIGVILAFWFALLMGRDTEEVRLMNDATRRHSIYAISDVEYEEAEMRFREHRIKAYLTGIGSLTCVGVVAVSVIEGHQERRREDA